MTKKEQKAATQRVSSIYSRRCHGIAIDIFDMGKVMKVGLDAVAAGEDDAGIGDKIATFVQTIRKN